MSLIAPLITIQLAVLVSINNCHLGITRENYKILERVDIIIPILIRHLLVDPVLLIQLMDPAQSSMMFRNRIEVL